MDTRADPEAVRQLMEHWSAVALSRFGAGQKTDLFAYNLLSVSHADLSRIRELLRWTYREIRSIVAASQPSRDRRADQPPPRGLGGRSRIWFRPAVRAS